MPRTARLARLCSIHKSECATHGEVEAPNFIPQETCEHRLGRREPVVHPATATKGKPRKRSRAARRERSQPDRRRPTGSRHRGLPVSPPGSYPKRRSPARCVDGLLPLRALRGCTRLRGQQRGQGTGDRVAAMAGSQEAAGEASLEHGNYCGNVTLRTSHKRRSPKSRRR
jgi:hypothetical protein